MVIIYRNATSDDTDRICYVVKHKKAVIYPDYYTQAVVDFINSLTAIEKIKKDIEQNRIYVLVKDGEIIGTGSRTENHITRVYVLPKYQGQGNGCRIMDELEKEIFESIDKALRIAPYDAGGFEIIERTN